MDNDSSQYLLPSGLRDLLPPEAGQRTHILSSLQTRFELAGYAPVMPPLAEFEDTLLTDKNHTLATQTFRVMDPVSGRMLALRPDMTPQISRIAASRLSNAPLPLRLCYAGTILRSVPQGLSAERQLTQAGIELIGSDSTQADSEVILVTLEALQTLGFTDVVVDLNAAGLLDTLVHTPEEREQALNAIRHKDASVLPDTDTRDILAGLMQAAGPLASARNSSATLALPERAQAFMTSLLDIGEALAAQGIHVTADPLESSGFEYHNGICFALYDTKSQQEIGRGGRYTLTFDHGPVSATGATLYADRLFSPDAPQTDTQKAYIPYGTPPNEAATLRSKGVVTVMALEPEQDDLTEAARLGCTHVYANNTLKNIT